MFAEHSKLEAHAAAAKFPRADFLKDHTIDALSKILRLRRNIINCGQIGGDR